MVEILLVEDNIDDIDLTKRSFKKSNLGNNGYKLVSVNDGVKAIEYLREGNRPELVLLDLNLPRADGFEVLKYIRSNHDTKLIPVVILSSSTEKNDIKRAYTLGANSYLKKPVDSIKFNDLINTIGNYWLLQNESINQ